MTNDCKIDLSDLALELSVFGTNNPTSDFDHNGSVDLANLALLLSKYELNCN